MPRSGDAAQRPVQHLRRRAIGRRIVRHIVGVEHQPALVVQHAVGYRPRCAPCSRSRVSSDTAFSCARSTAPDIHARMHAAHIAELRRHEALGARRDAAEGKGIADRRLAAVKPFRNSRLRSASAASAARRQARRRLVAPAMAAQLMPRRHDRAQVGLVIEFHAFHGAAAKAAGRIISAAHAVPGQHRPPRRPGALGEVVEGDAGDRRAPLPAAGGGLSGVRAARLVSRVWRVFRRISWLFSAKALTFRYPKEVPCKARYHVIDNRA